MQNIHDSELGCCRRGFYPAGWATVEPKVCRPATGKRTILVSCLLFPSSCLKKKKRATNCFNQNRISNSVHVCWECVIEWLYSSCLTGLFTAVATYITLKSKLQFLSESIIPLTDTHSEVNFEIGNWNTAFVAVLQWGFARDCLDSQVQIKALLLFLFQSKAVLCKVLFTGLEFFQGGKGQVFFCRYNKN